jgi:hypothetical protein
MPLYAFTHSLLNVLVQIANKTGFQKKLPADISFSGFGGWSPAQEFSAKGRREQQGRARGKSPILALPKASLKMAG